MSPLLVMDDVCIVGAGLTVLLLCSSKNEDSVVPKKERGQKKFNLNVKKVIRNAGTHRLSFGTHHSWITPQAHWTLRTKKNKLMEKLTLRI